jgi:transposase
MKELYYYLIGLIEPWTIDDVQFQVKSQQVDIWVSYKSNSCQCGECEESSPIYDHVNERSWRHLDSCGYKTFVYAKIPRIKCSQHAIHQVNIPWAQAHSRFTLMFQQLAIDI